MYCEALTDHPHTKETEILIFRTRLGYAAVAYDGGTLVVVAVGCSSANDAKLRILQRFPAADNVDQYEGDLRAPGKHKELAERITAFCDGEPISFGDIELQTAGWTPLRQRVMDACREISWGQTVSYGELARRVGRPGAARAVGNFMAQNPFPLVVPCHRVIGSAGNLGGYSAPTGIALKKQLLALEQKGQIANC